MIQHKNRSRFFKIGLGLLVLISFSTLSYSQNYVHNITPRIETTDISTLSNTDKIEVINYFDGLGRPIQQIALRAGGNSEDIITPMVYDVFGRQLKDYLPFVRMNSSLNYEEQDPTFFNALNSQYVTKYGSELDAITPNPYSEKYIEASPLGRIMEQGAPGKDWILDPNSDTDHTIKFEYAYNSFDSSDPTNSANDNIVLYDVTFDTQTGMPQLINDQLINDGGYYAANTLYKTITKDENWQPNQQFPKDHTTEEFKNKQGRVILKRTYNNGVAHDTQYVYDDFGNLAYVLPPLSNPSDGVPADLDELCYQYHYDHRNRLIEKKIPGKGLESIVYDKLDRPVLTQDANLEAVDKWLFTKYDAFGRVVYTGMMTSTSIRSTLQGDVDAHAYLNESRLAINTPNTIEGTTIYYTNDAFPNNTISNVTINDVYTINYYDDYDWNANSEFSDSDDITYSVSNFSFHNGTLTKNGPSASTGWNAGFTTNNTIQGDGFIEFTVSELNCQNIEVGLSKANLLLDDSYNTIGYGIYTGSGTDQRIRIFEEGIYKELPSSRFFEIGDVFKVERSGSQIVYKHNEQVFYLSSVPTTGELVGDGAFYGVNSSISNIRIGSSVFNQSIVDRAKGLPTGSLVRVLETSDWIITTPYYDRKGRPIYTTSENGYLNTTDVFSSELNFIGNPIKIKNSHIKDTNDAIVTLDYFDYDHANRLLTQEQRINTGNKEHISSNTYDELGQLEQKRVGGSTSNGSNFNLTNITKIGNTVTKTSSNGWDAELSTQGRISGDGYISYTLTSTAYATMVGLSYTDDGVSPHSIDFAIYANQYGDVSIWENGTYTPYLVTYLPGDVFKIKRIGTIIKYLKNNDVFYTSTIAASTSPMLGDVSMFHFNSEIVNLELIDTENSLQNIDYAYNIRGWLKSINDADVLGNDLFGFKLNYNTVENTNTTKLYNGNISETFWNTASIDPITEESEIKRGYSYNYDALNRILEANFEKSSGINQNVLYELSGISYDKNGNINSLKRTGVNDSGQYLSEMDDLTYSYDGNQLTDVSELGSHSFGFKDTSIQSLDYDYDVNGNMIEDKNKGITSISYNHLNLPTNILINDNAQNIGSIQYFYDATGVKLKKVVSTGTDTEYAGNYIYENGDLKFFSQPEGYIEPNNNNDGYDYIYQYKDHLGNIRLTYTNPNDNYELLINDAFYEDYDGWVFEGGAANGSLELENGRLKVNVKNPQNGVKFHIDESFNVGDQMGIFIDIDKGNTNTVRLLVNERDANDNHIAWYVLSQNLQTGSHSFNHTIVAGTKLRIKIDKNGDIGVDSHFYVDNVSVSTGDLEIIEENNYYPFGLKHKGYNSNVSANSNSAAGKFRFNGIELEEALDLNLYEMMMRQYDPAIARWTSIDPITHYDFSTYSAFDNNPVYWADPSGADSGNAWTTTFVNRETNESIFIDDGTDRTIYVNDSQFEEARFFFNEFNGGSFGEDGEHDDEIVSAYYDFYNGVNSYDGLTAANVWDYLTNKPIIEAVLADGEGDPAMAELVSWVTPELKYGGQIAAVLLARLKMIHKHHIIPKAVYKKYVKALESMMKLNGGSNLKKIPTPFHGNHPQYNKYVADKIDNMINNGNINPESIRAMQKELNTMINQAYDSGKKLNDYFRQFNN